MKVYVLISYRNMDDEPYVLVFKNREDAERERELPDDRIFVAYVQ